MLAQYSDNTDLIKFSLSPSYSIRAKYLQYDLFQSRTHNVPLWNDSLQIFGTLPASLFVCSWLGRTLIDGVKGTITMVLFQGFPNSLDDEISYSKKLYKSMNVTWGQCMSILWFSLTLVEDLRLWI